MYGSAQALRITQRWPAHFVTADRALQDIKHPTVAQLQGVDGEMGWWGVSNCRQRNSCVPDQAVKWARVRQGRKSDQEIDGRSCADTVMRRAGLRTPRGAAGQFACRSPRMGVLSTTFGLTILQLQLGIRQVTAAFGAPAVHCPPHYDTNTRGAPPRSGSIHLVASSAIQPLPA